MVNDSTGLFSNPADKPQDLPQGTMDSVSLSESPVQEKHEKRQIDYKRLPLGTWLLEKSGIMNFRPSISHKAMILVITFMAYMSTRTARKSFSVVKVVLCPLCANCTYLGNETNQTVPGWPPFNESNGNTLLGAMDYVLIFAYAISIFVSGWIADRVNLRYFLFAGMTGSAVGSILFGLAYWAEIHSLWYFVPVQIFTGFLQGTAWPATIAIMSSWFGKQNRGFILAVWSTHTPISNILGNIIPSFWADCSGENDQWGWSFVVPSVIVMVVACALFLLLVIDPRHVGLPPPVHNLDEPNETPRTDATNPMAALECEEENKTSLEQEVDVIYKNKSLENGTALNSEDNPAPKKSDHTEEEKSKKTGKSRAVSIFRAILIPGLIEFSLAFFFLKMVSYVFLTWLPFYVKNTLSYLTGPQSDWLSTVFDIGGIAGVIGAGFVSDRVKARAIVCVAMIIISIPSLLVLDFFSGDDFGFFLVMLIVCGFFIQGPFGVITSAVASDLGTHESLQNDQTAKATVGAIIDGTGSLGAAFGPLLIGWVTTQWDWNAAFYVLMIACFMSALLLTRLVVSDIRAIRRRCLDKGLCVRRRRESNSFAETRNGVELTSVTRN